MLERALGGGPVSDAEGTVGDGVTILPYNTRWATLTADKPESPGAGSPRTLKEGAPLYVEYFPLRFKIPFLTTARFGGELAARGVILPPSRSEDSLRSGEE